MSQKKEKMEVTIKGIAWFFYYQEYVACEKETIYGFSTSANELKDVVQKCLNKKVTKIEFYFEPQFGYSATNMVFDISPEITADEISKKIERTQMERYWNMIPYTDAEKEAKRIHDILTLRSHGTPGKGIFYPPHIFDEDWRIKLNIPETAC